MLAPKLIPLAAPNIFVDAPKLVLLVGGNDDVVEFPNMLPAPELESLPAGNAGNEEFVKRLGPVVLFACVEAPNLKVFEEPPFAGAGLPNAGVPDEGCVFWKPNRFDVLPEGCDGAGVLAPNPPKAGGVC